MKKYRDIFSTFHTVFRLVTTSSNMKTFIMGVGRLYKNTFNGDRIIIVCKHYGAGGFIKLRMENNVCYEKKGSISILSSREREILRQEKELVHGHRLIYPLVFSDTLGMVYIKRDAKKSVFDEFQKRWFLALSEEISIGLKIFSLYRDERRIIINYVNSMSRLLDQFVPTSCLHTKNIFKLIRIMGKAMCLSEAEIKSLEYASLLHDAGKIQLPTRILKKQQPLTDEEFKLIRRHPREGIELIKDVEYLKPVVPIILHHHEKFDGTGYPAKLKKDQIPLGSRILSVIDAFDAMYYGRPYRKKISLLKIETELRAQAHYQFDPRIVEIFLRIIKSPAGKKILHIHA